MASIQKRGDSYQITVLLGMDEDRKKIRKTTTYKPKSTAPSKALKEAQAFALEFENQVLNGYIPLDEDMTFSQAVEIWEQNWLQAKTPIVRENYKAALRVRVTPYIGTMKITKIRAAHIDAIMNRLKAEGKAPATIRTTFSVINSVFRYAFKKGVINENPCARCDDLPSVAIKRGTDLQFFNLDQTKRFLNDALTMNYEISIKAHKRKLKKTGEEYEVPAYKEVHSVGLQWRVYFNLAIYGGFRRGELCALTWKDIDTEKRIISINKAAIQVSEGRIIKDPKTKSAFRDIVVPSVCIDLLNQLKKEQIQQALKLGTAWEGHRNQTDEKGNQIDSFEENTVFTTAAGGPVSLSTPYHKFGEIIDLYNETRKKEAEKLPKIRLHDLRHTSITLLLAQNTDIETVAHRAGHSKASVTLDIYGHALPAKDQTASNTLESLIGNA